MKKLKKFLLSTCVPALVILSAVGLAINPTGCSSAEAMGGLEVLEGDYEVPQLENFSVISENKVKVSFDKDIKIVEASLNSEEGEVIEVVNSSSVEENSKSLIVEFRQATRIGINYMFDFWVKDLNGNSVKISISFSGYNNNPAKMIFSELRNAYGTVTSNGITTHRGEFVEFYVLKSGNLSGLEVYSANDGDSKKYVFPAVEVKAGEYVTVHMRKPGTPSSIADADGMIDELGDDLTLSYHTDSCGTARDLWAENTKSVFADNDIVVLRNSADHKIMDSLPFAKLDCYYWDNEDVIEYSSELLDSQTWQNLWEEFSCEAEYAANSEYITSTTAGRSLSRQNIPEIVALYAENPEAFLPNNRKVWMVTADKGSGSSKVIGVTPGYENSSNAYVN